MGRESDHAGRRRPYSLTFSDGEKLTIGNVLVGEVWVCSGQSNMEMPMRGFNSQPILNGNELITTSTNSKLRLLSWPALLPSRRRTTARASGNWLPRPRCVSSARLPTSMGASFRRSWACRWD
ncbi:MAG: hypothetical protein WKG07_00835 [Hymenobacter sp.]